MQYSPKEKDAQDSEFGEWRQNEKLKIKLPLWIIC